MKCHVILISEAGFNIPKSGGCYRKFHMRSICCDSHRVGRLMRQVVGLRSFSPSAAAGLCAVYLDGCYKLAVLSRRLHSPSHTHQTGRCTPPAGSERCRTDWARGEPCWILKLCRNLRWSSSRCRKLRGRKQDLKNKCGTAQHRPMHMLVPGRLQMGEELNGEHNEMVLFCWTLRWVPAAGTR